MQTDCRVSFVVTSRNDDHGGDMLRRFRIFAEGLLNLANRYRLSGELIVVEWNPPPGPQLHDVLNLRTRSDTFSVRFIEVPPEAHTEIRNSDVIPLFQMIAKNVGIRRARGKFVVATNPDLIFSDALISFLATGELRRDVMYRIDRYDVPGGIPEDASLDEQLAWCAANVLRVHRKRGSFAVRPSLRVRVRRRSVVDLFGGVRKLFRPQSAFRRALWELLALADTVPRIHTNGCGDFTMLAREQWFALRGYPELPVWSLHLDSLLCYMAVASGLRERVVPPPAKIFHSEHQSSWTVMTSEQRLRTFAVKPWIDTSLVDELWRHMYRTRRPLDFNTEGWGLAEWPLKEVFL